MQVIDSFELNIATLYNIHLFIAWITGNSFAL